MAYLKILWRDRPMREVIKFRNLKELDCATVADRCRVLPPLPSPLFAPRVARLGWVHISDPSFEPSFEPRPVVSALRTFHASRTSSRREHQCEPFSSVVDKQVMRVHAHG
jgi:hypothetical protein